MPNGQEFEILESEIGRKLKTRVISIKWVLGLLEGGSECGIKRLSEDNWPNNTCMTHFLLLFIPVPFTLTPILTIHCPLHLHTSTYPNSGYRMSHGLS